MYISCALSRKGITLSDLKVRGMLSTVVGGVALIPAALAYYLTKKHAPLPVVLVLGHVAASGFAVAIAATDRFAHRSTFLLGKARESLPESFTTSRPKWRDTASRIFH
jgi:hypothetical protein